MDPRMDGECEHTSPRWRGILSKHRFRMAPSPIFRQLPDATNYNQYPALQPKCYFCAMIYPIWEEYELVKLQRAPSDRIEGRGRDEVYIAMPEEGKTAFGPLAFLPGRDLRNGAFRVELKDRQYGEAYHPLICCLLLQAGHAGIQVGIDFKAEKDPIDDIIQLFEWYKLLPRPGVAADAQKLGKDKATRVIAAAFRSTNNGFDIGDSLKQAHLFQRIRGALNTSSIWPQLTARLPKRRVEFNVEYCWPDYAAKFWLNRYLNLTQNTKLPKRIEVGRLALIHVRLHAKSPIGRIMDGENLEYVAGAIADANTLAREAEETQFTHVILYGDFPHASAAALKSKVEKHLNSSKTTAAKPGQSPVKVLYISSPWKPDGKRGDGMNRDVYDLWAKFRDANFDHLPVQVKTLAIWTALCERYNPRMCIIGHRSGFIEGGGFIGIPIFYLNNEPVKMGTSLNAPGELLWNTIEPENQNRLLELTDTMNTFIPISSLKRKDSSGTFRVGKEQGWGDELPAALFMFMCCGLEKSLEKLLSFNTPILTQEHPGWTARVDMMHDKPGGTKKQPALTYIPPTCEVHGQELQTCNIGCGPLPHQTGQEWLRSRYVYATTKEVGRRPVLSSWYGVVDGKWQHDEDLRMSDTILKPVRHFQQAYSKGPAWK